MSKGRKILFQFGRTLFAIPFLIFCVVKIMNWQTSMESLDHALNMWKTEITGGVLSSVIDFLIRTEIPLMVVACGLEFIGALLLLVGFHARLGAFALIVFLVFITLVMHPFWLADPTTMHTMMFDFLKNVGLIGAAFVLASKKECGSGCACGGQCQCHNQRNDHHRSMDDRV